jgi:2,4-dichlorophenol 6-monooxygenase
MLLTGRAKQGLLDSYEAERRPVAAANTALSVANFHESLAVPRALGLDPRAASALQAALTSPLTAGLPSGEPTEAIELAGPLPSKEYTVPLTGRS